MLVRTGLIDFQVTRHRSRLNVDVVFTLTVCYNILVLGFVISALAKGRMSKVMKSFVSRGCMNQ